MPQAHRRQWPIPQPHVVGPPSHLPARLMLYSIHPCPSSQSHRRRAELGLRSDWAGRESLRQIKPKPKSASGKGMIGRQTSSDSDRVTQQLRLSLPCSWLLAPGSLLPQASQRARTTGVKLPSQMQQGPGSGGQLALACDKGGPILATLIGWPHEHGLTVTLHRRM